MANIIGDQLRFLMVGWKNPVLTNGSLRRLKRFLVRLVIAVSVGRVRGLFKCVSLSFH